MTGPIFPRLALIGIGLIGSSIALAARHAGVVGHVAINSRTPKTLARAEELRLGGSHHANPAGAVLGAGCVILGAPVGASGAVAGGAAGGARAARNAAVQRSRSTGPAPRRESRPSCHQPHADEP